MVKDVYTIVLSRIMGTQVNPAVYLDVAQMLQSTIDDAHDFEAFGLND